MRRCVYPRRGRGLTEGVTAYAVGAGAHLRSAYRWCQPMPHAPSAVASCGWGYAYGDVLRRWGKPMDGGRCGCAIRWVMADDVVRQAPKDGCIIVAPGWLAYLGLVVEGGNLPPKSGCINYSQGNCVCVGVIRFANRGMTFLQPLFGGSCECIDVTG